MKFPIYLALRNLIRRPARNLLYVLGISITAALLLDMILLAGGIKVSLARFLKQLGYEIRISPRGTLPFETDAQIHGFEQIARELRKIPAVDSVDALLGSNTRVEFGGQAFPAFLLGVKQKNAVFYSVREGSEPGRNTVLVNQYLARDRNIRPGDRLRISPVGSSYTIGSQPAIEVIVSGTAYFPLDAEGQYSLACSLPLLQEFLNAKDEDPASVILVKLKDSAQSEQISEAINRRFPELTAYSINTVIEVVDNQLSYFKQFAYILGGISLIVTFVLIFIITTISFHDRIGEFALLRAIGLSNKTLFTTVLFEGAFISLASTVFGFLLGKFVAIYLDRILKAAPGLPEDFSFFVLEPSSFFKALLTLLLTGFLAGLYPASAAVRLNVAETMREEIL